jgi:hypothetical protein
MTAIETANKHRHFERDIACNLPPQLRVDVCERRSRLYLFHHHADKLFPGTNAAGDYSLFFRAGQSVRAIRLAANRRDNRRGNRRHKISSVSIEVIGPSVWKSSSHR